MTVEDLRGVAGIASELVKEDRRISSSASWAIQRAKLSSSAKSSSSVSSIIVGRETGPGPGPGPWVIDEDVLEVGVVLAEFPNPGPGVV